MFNPNLVIIKDGKDVLGLYKVKYDYTKKKYTIDIVKEDGTPVVLSGKLNANTFIDLDISNGPVIIKYVNEHGKTFFKERLDLDNYINKNLASVDVSTKAIVEKVKQEMDNPKGTSKEVEHHTLMLKEAAFDKKARFYVEEKIRQILLREDTLSSRQIEKLTKKIYAKFYGMGVLQELDDDKDVSEIMVNATSYPEFECNIYYIKTNEPKKKYNKTFNNLDELLNVFSRAVSFSRKELNNLENATVEATRANGDRVNVIIPDASEGYILNIRKFSNFVPSIENMKKMGTIDDYIDDLMKALVRGKANIGIGGEMGTGKTTFINYLLCYTKPIERKVIISSVKEVAVNKMLQDHDIVFLRVDEDKGFTFKNLIKTALRTTADRIVIPESRGDEFKQVYEANLKTKGNMFTAHALDDESFLDMCVDMYVEDSFSGDISFIKNKIAKSIDIIIIMKKINNKFRIKSISEVIFGDDNRFQGLNLLYYWDFAKNRYEKTDRKLSKGLKQRLFEEGVEPELISKL